MQKIIKAIVILKGVGLGLLFLAVWLGFQIQPEKISAHLFVSASEITGIGTIRGDLGGLFLGLSIFTFLGTFSKQAHWYYIPIVFLAAVLFGRLLNVGIQGMSETSLRPIVIEAILLGAFVAAVYQKKLAEKKNEIFSKR